MFLSEYIGKDTDKKLYDWGQFDCYNLKYKYKNEHASEVVTYKVNKEELDKTLKRLNLK